MGQAQTLEWASSAGGTLGDEGHGVAVDADGNTYVTGTYRGTATFGAFVLTSAGGRDIFVAKYDASGSVVWARSAGGTLSDSGDGIDLDSAGNIYVAGEFNGTATFGAFVLTSAGSNFNVFVAKYDAAGNVVWARSAGGTLQAQTMGIAVDASGNSHVTGLFNGTATFGSFVLNSAGSFDVFLAKYDDVGNVVWARSDGGTSSDWGRGVTVDAGGSSYVTGQFFGTGTATFGSFVLTGTGDDDIFVAKYDASGSVVWARSGGGTLGDRATDIAVDASGNCYVTGIFSDTATFGSFVLTSAGSEDVLVAKYDAAGNVVWARSAGGTLLDVGFGIAVDAGSNCYVTGFHEGTGTFGPFVLTSAGGIDIFVAKYDAAGDVVWARSAGGTSASEWGFGIAVDADGNSYATGFYSATATFDPFVLTSAGSNDIFVVKYAAPPSTIPTVSEWGLVVMSLLVLTTGTLVYAQRHPAQA